MRRAWQLAVLAALLMVAGANLAGSVAVGPRLVTHGATGQMDLVRDGNAAVRPIQTVVGATGFPGAVAWQADISDLRYTAAELTTGPGGVSYGCGGPMYSARTFSLAGEMLGNLPPDPDGDVCGQIQPPLTDPAGIVYMPSGGSLDSLGWANRITAYTFAGTPLWSTLVPVPCLSNSGAGFFQWPTIGVDGNIYMVVRVTDQCAPDDRLGDPYLVGLNAATGAVILNFYAGPVLTPGTWYSISRQIAVLPYQGGLVVRAGSRTRYFDYRGNLLSEHIITDHQVGEGRSVVTVDGRFVTGTAKPAYPTQQCDVGNSDVAVESWGLAGMLWRTMVPGCRSLFDLVVTPDGGAVGQYIVTENGQRFTELVGFSNTGAVAWRQAFDTDQYNNVLAGIDVGGRVVLMHSFGEEIPDVPPWNNPQGVVQLIVIDSRTGASQTVADTRSMPAAPTGVRNYALLGSTRTVGFSPDQLTIPLTLCPQGGGCLEYTSITLTTFSVPGIGFDYPRAALAELEPLVPIPHLADPGRPDGTTEAPARRPPAAGCSEVLFLGARGSGQAGPGTPGWTPTTEDPYGFGDVVASAYGTFTSTVEQGRYVQPISLNYPAGNAIGAVFDPVDYFNGLSTGVNVANNLLRRRAETCPNERLVLVGYSQGAMVFHRILHDLWNSGTGQSIIDRIDAAILVGDGDRVPNDYTSRYGSMNPANHGIGLDWPSQSGSGTTLFPSAIGVRVAEVCQADDFVCDQPTGLAGVLIHLGYDGSEVLASASADAARDVLSHPAPRPATVTITAIAGTPVSVQLEADIDPDYSLEWGLLPPVVLPAGLTLTSTGLISGTPTVTASGSTSIRVRGVILGVAGDWVTATIVWNPRARPDPV